MKPDPPATGPSKSMSGPWAFDVQPTEIGESRAGVGASERIAGPEEPGMEKGRMGPHFFRPTKDRTSTPTTQPYQLSSKQGKIAGKKGVPRVHCVEINVSDIKIKARMAAMKAEKAMSCVAVARSKYISAFKRKHALGSIGIRKKNQKDQP